MSKNTKNTKATVKAEVVKFNPMLNAEMGYTDDTLVSSIKNPTMRGAVQSYKKAVIVGNKSAWAVAKACAKMKIDVRQEFESDDALAYFLGLPNRMAFSRLHRLGALANEAEALGLTTTPVTELLVLAGEKYGKLDPKDHLKAIVGMTKDEVRNYVKKFKIAIEDKEQESEKVEETADETSIAGDTEQEISWRSVLSIDADVLADMGDADRESLIYDLKGIAEKYGLSQDSYWISTK